MNPRCVGRWARHIAKLNHPRPLPRRGGFPSQFALLSRPFCQAPPTPPAGEAVAPAPESKRPPVRRIAKPNRDAEGRDQGGWGERPGVNKVPDDDMSKTGVVRPLYSWGFALGIIVVMAGAVILFNEVMQHKQSRPHKIEAGGTPLIGGDWSMIDHTGKRVTNRDYQGKYLMIYFGFTFCPDVCPRELTKIANALDILERRGVVDEVIPIMCSVDPRRDGPKQIAKYIGQFHPRIVGLTGTVAQVSKFVKTMRAYYSQPPKDAKDYIIDHVTMVYILDRDGEFRDYADSAHTAEQLADKMCECMPDVRGTGFLGRFIDRVTGGTKKKSESPAPS